MEDTFSRHTSVALLILGPVAFGAVLGIPFGAGKILTEAAALPALVLALTLLMAPALYIGLSIAGAAPPARSVGTALVDGLRINGTVLVGVAPAAAFLLATTEHTIAAYATGVMALTCSSLAGLRAIYKQLEARAVPVFVVWSIVLLGLGAHFFVSTLGG